MPSGSTPPSTTTSTAGAGRRRCSGGSPGTCWGCSAILAVLEIHPNPAGDLYLSLGDRLGTRDPRPRLRGHRGRGRRGDRARPLPLRALPGRCASTRPSSSTPIATAFVDEAVFRGIVFGFLISTSMDPNLANVIQALVYALATRLGAPGRPWYMLVTVLVIGLAGGWLTGHHRRHRGGVPGPRDHADRDLPDHRPRRHPQGARHRGRGGRAPAPDARGLAGPGHAGRRGALSTDPARGRGPAAGRALRPRPVLRLALPVLRLRGLRGVGGAGPGRARRRRSRTPLLAELGLRADAADARVRAGPGRRCGRVYLGGGTPTLLPVGVDRGASWTSSGPGSGSPTARR